MNNPIEGWLPKVTLLTTYPHGGAGVACRRLAGALGKSGIETNLLTQSDVSGRFNFIAERLTFLPWERNKSVRFSFSLANFGSDISKHPLINQADVIHLHWWNQGFLSMKNLAQLGRLNKTIVWTLHDMWAFTGGCHYDWGCGRYQVHCGNCPYLRFRFENDLSNSIWRRKQTYYPKNMRIVTCSKWLAEKARSSSLLSGFSITDIPNPIDTEQFKPVNRNLKNEFRQKLGLEPDTPLILFAAMNIKNPFKGFVYFKEAISALQHIQLKKQPVVVVVGKGDQADFEGLPFPVRQLGLIRDPNEMAHIYASCDVFVIPSLEENLPNTIMESLSSGTPVVGFDVGGIPEMIEDGICGKVTTAKNSRQMAADIAWVLQDEVHQQRLGLQARAKVLNQYTEQIVAEKYLSIYRR
ncbi:MAG: glycosyltransferase family 4 protein [Saprospiraceae bacterium]|nr:glycosyltransferase family 4 protein [Saprospiraceae bacterium]